MQYANQNMNDLIRAILQGARSQPASVFQDWALELLKSVIPFDAGIWVSGTFQDEHPVVHTVHLHHLAADAIDACVQRFESSEPFLQRVLEQPGKTIDLYDVMSREAFMQSDLCHSYGKITGMEHAIATAIVDPESTILNIIALYRRDYSDPFTHNEKQSKVFISPILVDACMLNLCIDLFANNTGSYAEAICDGKGILREADTAFAALIREEWPDWSGPGLCFDPETLLAGIAEATFQGERIVIRMMARNDLIRLQARRRTAFDTLTPGEQEITRHLAAGLANKAIANKLGIAVKTVDNHLQHIYKKLGIHNRSVAIAMLKEEL